MRNGRLKCCRCKPPSGRSAGGGADDGPQIVRCCGAFRNENRRSVCAPAFFLVSPGPTVSPSPYSNINQHTIRSKRIRGVTVTPANFLPLTDDPESFIAKVTAVVIFTSEMAGTMVRSIRQLLGRFRSAPSSRAKVRPRIPKKPNRSVKTVSRKRRVARVR